DDFCIRPRLIDRIADAKAHAKYTPAVEQQSLGQCIGDEPQVRTLQRRTEEALGSVPADALVLVDLEEAGAFVVAVVEIGARHDAELLRTFLHGFQNVPAQALLGHLPLTTCAVELVLAGMVVFGADE